MERLQRNLLIYMKTFFPKQKNHKPQTYFIDASKHTLGRLSTIIILYLLGKNNSYFSPSIDQGNFVIVLNAKKVFLLGKKDRKKIYYRNNQRPGSLKKETFLELKKKFPNKIIEKSVLGMISKNKTTKKYLSRLIIYKDDLIKYKKIVELKDISKIHKKLINMI